MAHATSQLSCVALISCDPLGGVGQRSAQRLASVGKRTPKLVDEREKRRQVVIDLVRLVLERTSFGAEGIPGDYYYQQAPNWEAERRKIMRRISFQAV